MRAQVRVAGDLERIRDRDVPGERRGIVESLIVGLAVGQVARAGDPRGGADIGAHVVGRPVGQGDRALTRSR